MFEKLGKIRITQIWFLVLLKAILLIAVMAILGACIKVEKDDSYIHWHYSDLRAIDPVDAKSSDMDIIAIYVKEDDRKLSIRLDMLELSPSDQQDIFIGLDYRPIGTDVYQFRSQQEYRSEIQWDIAVSIESSGKIMVYNSFGDPISGIKARVLQDTSLDIFTITIDKQKILPGRVPINIEVLIVDPFSGQILDRTEPVNSKAIPPNPAYVILLFDNTFQAYTPAQALRMWDGAHTGPMSSRHGLRHLIESAVDAGVYMNVCDLNSQVSFVALDYLGLYNDLMSMVSDGFLSVYCCGCLGGNGYAKYEYEQSGDDLSIKIREKLINAAMTNTILYIGGDLSDSGWGIPAISKSAFDYINNHPWIKTLRISDILRTSSYIGFDSAINQGILDSIDVNLLNRFLKQYYSTPDNTIKELARQTFTTIALPPNQSVKTINQNYFGQLGHILAAANWYYDPFTISTCDVNLDWDESNECILSSENFYLTFETAGGYLAFAFFRNDNGVHQIIAPMSEIAIGLGDPSAFEKEFGVFADPSVIPGGLVTIDEREYIFDYETGIDFIKLFKDTAGISKYYQLINNSIHIGWDTSEALQYTIPFSLDPWLRYNVDWSDQYFSYKENENWRLGINDQISLQIQSSTSSQFVSFLDSKEYIEEPEDPNFPYPPGHYLPFTTAVLEILPTQSALIEVNIINR